STTIKEMEKMVKESLDNVPLLQIQRFTNCSACFIAAYREGLLGTQVAWANKKYHSHCTLPPQCILEAR
ncbi:hypothetical protein H4582DRAFT_1773974, partial [Lactarius indigo]